MPADIVAECCCGQGRAGAFTKVGVCLIGMVVIVGETVECWLEDSIAVKLAVVVELVDVAVVAVESLLGARVYAVLLSCVSLHTTLPLSGVIVVSTFVDMVPCLGGD